MTTTKNPERDLDALAKLLAPYLAPYIAALLGATAPAPEQQTVEQTQDRDVVDAMRAQGMSKSAVMRELWEAGNGWTRARIAKAMGVRYQFVYNQTPSAA